jgi:hypothetical protein
MAGAIKDEVEALPGSGVEGLATGIAEIRTEFVGLVAEGRTTLDQIRQLDLADELMKAIEGNRACQGLRDEERRRVAGLSRSRAGVLTGS